MFYFNITFLTLQHIILLNKICFIVNMKFKISHFVSYKFVLNIIKKFHKFYFSYTLTELIIHISNNIRKIIFLTLSCKKNYLNLFIKIIEILSLYFIINILITIIFKYVLHTLQK